MSIQESTTVQLTAKISEVSELLEDMIVELELRGCQSHHELIKRAIAMQKQLKNFPQN
ncbi:hypothetical protein [Psychromonas sp.]|uniref:hypothetical protein n=1 Tax=Psychromonas sp. TaxID=1884585 RepID=UPI00356B20E2